MLTTPLLEAFHRWAGSDLGTAGFSGKSVRKKLLYVASLPHSGSTLLNLILGQHPQMIGLGGIDSVMRWIERKPDEVAGEICSCGQPVGQCVYWKEVLAATRAQTPRNLADRYRVALEIFARVFGPDAWAVDAGQIHETVGELAGQTDIDLRTLFLVRDFRSAICSIVDLKRRKKTMRRPGFLLALEAALRWKRENKRIALALRQTGLPCLPVGYEVLCMRLRATFTRVCNFLEIAPFQASRDVHAGNNHSFVGNDMRKQASKSRVSYDYRWMTRSDWWLPGIIIPGMLGLNRDWVYVNGEDEVFRLRKSQG